MRLWSVGTGCNAAQAGADTWVVRWYFVNFFHSLHLTAYKWYLCIVKYSMRILVSVLMMSLFCFAKSGLLGACGHSGGITEEQSDQETSFSKISIKFLCHTSQSEYSSTGTNKLLEPPLKKNFQGTIADYKRFNKRFTSYFNQYTSIFRNFLILHRKADVIFPFHYFW